MAKNNVPVLGPDISRLTNEQIISWYAKHPNATVRSLVSRLEWTLEQQQKEVNAAYASGFTSQAKSHRLNRLSPEELEYLEA